MSTAARRRFEWQQIENEEPVIHTKGLPEPEIPERVKVPDYAASACPSRFGRSRGTIQDAQHLSFIQGARPRRLASASGAQLAAGHPG